MFNICLATDSYKYSHSKVYPEGTEYIFNYLESRGGIYDETVFFGLQYYLKEYLSKIITAEMVQEAKEIVDAHMGPGIFNYEGWMHIVENHGGRLPLEIKAVPEGSVVPTRNVLMTVENTDPKCYWLPGHIETLLMKVWAPITVATTSYKAKETIERYLMLSDNDTEGSEFMLHDFGYRGVSSEESAGLLALSHLTSFLGTDTIKALLYGKKYYGCEMAGFSIPATEHSTMTILGEEGEYRQMERFLEIFKNNPLKACVSDSYNIYKALDFWGTQKDKLEGTTLVVRPDSGEPISMMTECLEGLNKSFGSTVNEKGYKVLNGVKVIYGDGINDVGVIEKMLDTVVKAGYSAKNVAFGMGGGLLQKINRDSLKFAMKCSSATINGEQRDVYKNPVSDSGKSSKKGRLDLSLRDGKYTTIIGDSDFSALETVFHNGKIVKEVDLDVVRNRINKGKL